MSLAMLKQNAQILLEVSQNYETLLQKKKLVSKEENIKIEVQLKNFRGQFLYLITAINKLVQEEKNAK